MRMKAKFSDMLNKTLIKVDGCIADSEILFYCSDGSKYTQYHATECCESVYVEDIIGEFSDLLNYPLLMCEEVSNLPEGITPYFVNNGGNFYNENNGTWTFYRLGTINGYVTIRWFGYSPTGCYAETADFKKLN